MFRTCWTITYIVDKCHSQAMSCSSSISCMTTCIEEINQLMSSKRLKLSTDKTQFIWMGTRQQLAKNQCQTVNLRGTSIHISTEVTCLGAVIDSELKFALHIKRLAGRCFYQLRQFCSIRRSLNTDATKTHVNAFISSRVDYCNTVFSGTGAVHLRPIQSVLNSSHASLFRSVSLTRLQQQFQMSCTG